jgi:phage terminase large subunit-like protein
VTSQFRDEVEVHHSPEEEYVTLLAEQERRLKYIRWQEYQPYEKQKQWLNFDCKIKAMFGANRCLGSETMIYDPVAGTTRRVDEIDGDFHVWAWDGKKRVVAEAKRPYSKGLEEIYRFEFEDGTVITASPGHLFLSELGWMPAGVFADLPGFGAVRLPSSLDSDQSTRLSNVVRSMCRELGSPDGCLEGFRSHDEPLPLGPAFAPNAPPSLAGALGRSMECDPSRTYEPLGALGDGPEHTHTYPDSDPPPIPDGQRLLAVQFVDIESQAACRLSIPLDDLSPSWLQSDPASALRQSMTEADLDPMEFSKLSSACGHLLGIANQRAVRCDLLRKDIVWDFEVPEYGNYLIGNVLSHNTGKTYTAAFEMTCHLTGVYPDWWQGRKFFRPIQARCIAVSFEQLRKVMQAELIGDINYAFGSGMIPKDLIVDKSMRAGIPDTVDTIWVRHVPTGGISTCELMSNVQGREAMQGDAKQCVWIDEECDWDVFLENKMRTAGTGDKASGIIIITFTPLKGWTQLVKWLLKEPDKTVVRHITIGWDDVPHLSTKEKHDLSSGLLPHELEARSKGIPTMASGMIYPFASLDILVNPFDFEAYDKGLIGLDVAPVGTTAAVLLMEDYHAKMTYLVAEHYSSSVGTSAHAMAIRARFGRFPVRIDPSSQRRGSLDSDNIIKEYRDCLGESWDVRNAYNGVYSGISRLHAAMQEGRFKVFRNCHHWIEEWQNYLWDENKKTSEGHPVPRKKDDHCMDATRYGYWGVAVERAATPKDYQERQTSPLYTPLDPTTGY